MKACRGLVVSLTVATLACGQPNVGSPSISSTTTLPDAADGQTVPLDATDGFPLRVRVCSTAPTDALEGSLQAHVWLSQQVGGGTVSTGMALTDVLALTLEPQQTSASVLDPACAYSAIATLNAPGPGPVTVEADVVGVRAPSTCAVIGPALGVDSSCELPATVPDLIRLSDPIPLPIWNGSTPRYSVCAETAATKGTVTLTSPDPTLLSATQVPLTGTLLPDPCPAETLVDGGPKISHVNFDFSLALAGQGSASITPQFTVLATLVGMPATQGASQDPYVWVAQSSSTKPPNIGLSIDDFSPTGTAVATGEVFKATVHATQPIPVASTPIEGFPVSFASTSGVTFTPSVMPTDSSGAATSYVIVPFGSQIVVVASGGGVETEQILPAVKVPVAALVSTIAPTGDTLPNGEAFIMTTIATLKGTDVPIEGLNVSFSTAQSGSSAFSPASNVTDATGTTQSKVIVPYGTQVLATVVAGAAVESIASDAPTVVLSESFDTNALSPNGSVHTVTVTASLSRTSAPIEGLSVALALTSAQPSGTPAVAPTALSALTDASGNATFAFFAPGGDTSVTVVASAGGVVAERQLTP